MAETLKVEKRKSFGKRNNERLRRAGRLPAVLYGHGEESVSLTLASDQFAASLRHGLVATPPSAIRAARTAPLCTSSAAATEQSANA